MLLVRKLKCSVRGVFVGYLIVAATCLISFAHRCCPFISLLDVAHTSVHRPVDPRVSSFDLACLVLVSSVDQRNT